MMDRTTIANYRLPIIVALCLGVCVIAMVIAQQVAIGHRHAEQRQLAQTADSYEQQLVLLGAMESEVRDLRLRRDQAFASEGLAMGELLHRLGQDMIDSGASERQITTGTSTQLMQWTHTPISIRFIGNFHTVKAFLERVETYPIVIRPEQISVTRDNDENNPRLQIAMNFAALTRADAREEH